MVRKTKSAASGVKLPVGPIRPPPGSLLKRPKGAK